MEDTSSQFIHINVRNARTHIENGKAQFTDYEVEVKTNLIAFTLKHSRVRRRYSDFIWLRRRLAKDLMTSCPPTLPGRRLFGRFKKDFIKQRQKKLQQFLEIVVQNNMFLSHSALHLFLQSKLTVKEIEKYIDSKGDEDTSETILAGLPLDCRLESENESSTIIRQRSLSSADSAIESCNSEFFDSDYCPSDINANTSETVLENDRIHRKGSSDGNSADDEQEDGEDDESGVALDDEEMDQRLKDLRMSSLNLQNNQKDVESSVEYLFDETLINEPTYKEIPYNVVDESKDESFKPTSRRRRRSKRRKNASDYQFSLPEKLLPRAAVSVFDLSEKGRALRRCFSFGRRTKSVLGLNEKWQLKYSETPQLRPRQRHSFLEDLRSPAKRKISLNEYCIVNRDSVLSNCSFEETEFNSSL